MSLENAFILLPRVMAVYKILTASSKIRTRVTDSIFYDNNHCTISVCLPSQTSFSFNVCHSLSLSLSLSIYIYIYIYIFIFVQRIEWRYSNFSICNFAVIDQAELLRYFKKNIEILRWREYLTCREKLEVSNTK